MTTKFFHKKKSEDNEKNYTLLQTFYDSEYWTKVELLKGTNPHLKQEVYVPNILKRDKEIQGFFQEAEPCSSLFLLHHYQGKSTHKKSIPILLVHGASHDANMAWCKGRQREKGMFFELIQQEVDVFAITFAHSHGDNYMQTIQLANALERIQEITGAKKVNIIAHSKGGVPSRMYLSNFCHSYGAPYQNNVDKYIMLGTPNKGIDFTFRHKSPNWFIVSRNMSSPIACDSLFINGRYMNTTKYSIYKDGGAFTGQLQMLYKFDQDYPVRKDDVLYYGGQNFYFHSRGIDKAIEEGGFLMEKLMKEKIHHEIDMYVLAGTNQIFNYFMLGESSGPSDGLVFVESVLDVERMVDDKRQIKRKEKLFLNHSELLYDKKAKEWVKGCLGL